MVNYLFVKISRAARYSFGFGLDAAEFVVGVDRFIQERAVEGRGFFFQFAEGRVFQCGGDFVESGATEQAAVGAASDVEDMIGPGVGKKRSIAAGEQAVVVVTEGGAETRAVGFGAQFGDA